jgi:hypothetical protein
MAPPTRDIGAIDFSEIIGSQWVDINETIPDLIWPNSVHMYGRMRRDPRLAAILKGYSLPIRRATWRLDPTGCRDEVVQMVADDLGVTILGTDATPGPARRRGVNWGEHVRLALLSLTYGHMGFERRYEIRNNQARLVNLGERPPWTISMFNLNRDGTINTINQTIGITQPIPANRLVWYAHEREGAAWPGQSVLRPAYAPWLLKHELWRVHATSIRRFGMGIPSVEAPPAATPGQVEEARRLAASIRVGDQSGVGLPAGFKMSVTGMTGSVPDAMAYISYLDQQMSTMALAGFLDLGHTKTGSRALGESFIDLFMLSLQAVADEIADAATSGQPGMNGAVTDIVDLNWGEDEPAPRLVCTDVGQRHDLTAEAINGLISSGALTADADLEAYLRGTYRLPARAQEDAASGRSYQYDLDFGILTVNERRAQIGLQPIPTGDVVPEPASIRALPPTDPSTPPPVPVSAATTRRRRDKRAGVRAAGDLTAGNRQLTTTEAASGLDPDGLQADWQSELGTLVAGWAAVAAAQHADLATQVSDAIAAGDLTALADMTVDTGPAADLLAAAMIAMGAAAVTRMLAEAASQGVAISGAAADDDHLTEVAMTVALIMGSSLAGAAAREALRAATPGRSGQDVADLVTEHLTGLSDAWVADQLGGALTTAQNHGRLAVMAAGPTASWVSSEILDRNTCQPCRDIDGTVFASLEDAYAAYGTGAYPECLGGLRCRGTAIAVWNQE